MKLSEVKNLLKSNFNVISQKRKEGTFIAKKSYFYSNGKTPTLLAEKVLNVFPDAVIVNKGDHWRPFKGGAKSGSAQDSYMYVEFKLA